MRIRWWLYIYYFIFQIKILLNLSQSCLEQSKTIDCRKYAGEAAEYLNNEALKNPFKLGKVPYDYLSGSFSHISWLKFLQLQWHRLSTITAREWWAITNGALFWQKTLIYINFSFLGVIVMYTRVWIVIYTSYCKCQKLDKRCTPLIHITN